MQSVKLMIEGMSCGHCVGRVTSALKGVAGAEVVNVAIGSADVRLDPAKTSVAAVAAAVTSAGYPTAAGRPAEPLPVAKGCGSNCGCGTK